MLFSYLKFNLQNSKGKMKYLLIILSALTAFAALAVLRVLLYTFKGWLEGPRTNVLLPGLGLIISTPLFLVVLLVAEAVLVSLLIVFIRLIFKC